MSQTIRRNIIFITGRDLLGDDLWESEDQKTTWLSVYYDQIKFFMGLCAIYPDQEGDGYRRKLEEIKEEARVFVRTEVQK